MDIQIRTAGIGKWPVVRAMGHDVSENLGTTDQTVQFGIWRMVESYRTSGYLFDDDFAQVMRAVGVEPDADEEQAAAEPA